MKQTKEISLRTCNNRAPRINCSKPHINKTFVPVLAPDWACNPE